MIPYDDITTAPGKFLILNQALAEVCNLKGNLTNTAQEMRELAAKRPPETAETAIAMAETFDEINDCLTGIGKLLVKVNIQLSSESEEYRTDYE